MHISGQRISGKSFIHDEKLLIMPAFGSYTGGLNVTDSAIQGLLNTSVHYLIYRGRIWKMA